MVTTNKIVYLGLGGNVGDRLELLKKTIELIATIPFVIELEVSSFYETAPVSDIPQSDYLNAVCRLKTTLDVNTLLAYLQSIEIAQGKVTQLKNAPRTIDIDILFFGDESFSTKELQVPHPRWQDRLFVVAPLSDLASTITIQKDGQENVFDVMKLKESLSRDQSQRVLRLDS